MGTASQEEKGGNMVIDSDINGQYFRLKSSHGESEGARTSRGWERGEFTTKRDKSDVRMIGNSG